MAKNNPRLELTWIGKENRVRLEPRILYAKNKRLRRKIRNPLPRTSGQEGRYRNPDNDPRVPWLQGDKATARSGGEDSRYPIKTPSGRVATPPAGQQELEL